MFSRFKNALMSAVGGTEVSLHYTNDTDNELDTDVINSNVPITIETKPYSRPSFLGLTNEETQVIIFFNIFQVHKKFFCVYKNNNNILI